MGWVVTVVSLKPRPGWSSWGIHVCVCLCMHVPSPWRSDTGVSVYRCVLREAWGAKVSPGHMPLSFAPEGLNPLQEPSATQRFLQKILEGFWRLAGRRGGAGG